MGIVMADELTDKQRLFIEEYLTCWNATEAARRTHYANPNKRGPENVVKRGIREEIARRLAEKAMPADEVLARLSEHARIDADDFLFIGEEEVTLTSTVISETVEGEEPRRVRTVLKTETAMRPIVRLDLRRARERGKLHLIKEIKDGKDGLTVKLHDAQAALVHLGKHHGLFLERQELSGPGGTPLMPPIREVVVRRYVDDENPVEPES